MLAVVTSLTDDPDVLQVRYLDVAGSPAGDPVNAFVWPNMPNMDWETFVGTNIVVPVVEYLGVRRVMQLPRWDMMMEPEGAQIGDCPF